MEVCILVVFGLGGGIGFGSEWDGNNNVRERQD